MERVGSFNRAARMIIWGGGGKRCEQGGKRRFGQMQNA